MIARLHNIVHGSEINLSKQLQEKKYSRVTPKSKQCS